MEGLKTLWKLQQYETKIRDLKSKMKNLVLKNELKRLKHEILSEMSSLEQKTKTLEEARKSLRRTEMENRDISAKEKEIEHKLYGGEVTSVKELEQLEKKLKQLKSEAHKGESRTIDFMDTIEKLEEQVIKEQQKLQRDKENYRKYKLKYTQDVDRIKEELFNAEYGREELLESIDPELLEVYNHIKKKKNGIAVALIKNGVCSGCRMSLPVATISEVRKTDSVIMCENCGRILYLE